MVEASNQQRETTVQVDDTVGGKGLDVPHMDDGPSAEIRSSSGECYAPESNEYSPTFLLRILAFFSCCSGDNRSVTDTAGGLNMDDLHMEDAISLHEFSNATEHRGAVQTEDDKSVAVNSWNQLARYAFMSMAQTRDNNDSDPTFGMDLEMSHMFDFDNPAGEMHNASRERAGKVSVTRLNLFLTIVGFILYTVDLGSDIATAIFLANNRQWWQAIVTLAFVYGAVIFNTIVKWRLQKIESTGVADRLCYVASLLVNWPDMKQYWELCRLERQLHKSPVKNVRLISEWHRTRYNVAYLKFMEGLCEACPQAILQLYLLVPHLYGDWTWTDYLRIVGTSVSLCTAGAALVNWEKFRRFSSHTDVPLSELVVLHVWAVPVTVSRLLFVGLLLSVHPYWALAGVAPHLVLHGVYWCKTEGVPSDLNDVIFMGLSILLFCMSPFDVEYSIKYRRVSHAIHLLGNTAMMVVWALGTPLVCVHPALYTAIICLNAVMFAVGLVGWQLHEKHWPDRYLI